MMSQLIFINLPVQDLERSKAFYTALGFSINPQFSDENAACVVISDTIFVMLLTHSFFKRFTSRDIADARKTTEVLNCLSAESREKVDLMLQNAEQGGGQITRAAKDEHFMYGAAFEDPDGHIWEVMWMDMTQQEAGAEPAAAGVEARA